MKLRSLWLFALLIQFAPIAHAADCKATTFGKCFQVRGRYAIYADGDFLWIVGTKRMLSATNDELDGTLEKAGWQNYVIFGDFKVCPTSRYRKGQMQAARIQSYRNIRLAKRP